MELHCSLPIEVVPCIGRTAYLSSHILLRRSMLSLSILKDSDFSEVDRAECQFTTTATILDNGSQKESIKGRKESKCSGFFDFRCHIQYICFSWIVLFGLLLAIFPTVSVLLWLLHQKGVFDPLYDWWEDQVEGNQRPIYPRHGRDVPHSHNHHHKHHRKDVMHYKAQHKRKSSHVGHHKHHRHGHLEVETGHHHHVHDSHLHHVQKDRHKHTRRKNLVNIRPEYSDYFEEGRNSPVDDYFEYHRHKKEKGHF
ncbi:hypothetical protein ACHQM5_000831 [Ranunculus cassubicifolius]